MAKARSNTRRDKPKDNGRRTKKKISPLNSDSVEYIDYKDVDLLRRFMSDRAKIRGRRVSGNDSQQQREIARAIKSAREMGLLPYASQITTQRRGRNDRGERGDRGDRGDRGPRRDDAERSSAAEEPTNEAAADQPVEAVDAAAGGEA